MSSNLPETNLETHLFIGVNPREHDSDIIATFTGKNYIPLSWYFLFTPEDIRTRQEEFPDSWGDLIGDDDNQVSEIGLDTLEIYLKEPVSFKTTLPQAKIRIAEFIDVFQTIPYIWSYFKVIDILDQQLELFIDDLADNPHSIPAKKYTPYPEEPRSQVKIKESVEEKEEFISADDNPFAALENFGQDSVLSTDNIDDTFGDLELISALQAATELDKLKTEEFITEEIEEDSDFDIMPIVVHFDRIATGGRGNNFSKVLELIERLLHHAKREGRMTRIMQDYLQEIFREAQISWRITGLLAEDFVQGDPSQLADIMVGVPSPYVIIKETFDLEYWTTGTLQPGDERLMYTLSMLPSEKIHRAIRAGNLSDIANNIGQLLVTTKAIIPPKLSLENLRKLPSQSNIWGFRVLIQVVNKEYKAATILCSDPQTSWENEFKAKINLPGVLEDWNIEYPARFEEFSDIDNYHIVFEGAKDIEETFQGFVRWVRRNHIMYRKKYGVNGTVMYLKNILIDTQDKQLGILIFDILTNLTEFGIREAMDVLSDEVVVRKLPWLYS